MKSQYHEDLSNQITRPASPIRRLVTKKSRQLKRYSRLSLFGRDDIEQTIWKVIFSSLSKYDPDQGPLHSYCRAVIDSAISNFLRHHSTKLRQCDKQVSLGGTANEILTDEPGDGSAHDLWIDLKQVLEELPVEQRQICIQLMSSSKAESARQLNIPLATLKLRIQEITQRFREAGLEAYLPTGGLTDQRD